MKKVKQNVALIFLIFFVSAQFTNAQSTESQMRGFFSYKNDQAYWWLSKFAHPMNIFQSGSCEIYGNYVYVTINSTNNSARFKIHINGSIFDSIETESDTDFIKAFFATDVAKDILLEFWRGYSYSTIGKIENIFGKLDFIKSEHMCLAVLTALYWNYPKDASSSNSDDIVRYQPQTFRGCVGDYPITMSITFKKNYVEGTYYYNRMGPENKLTLLGTYEKGLMFLGETNEEGQRTGSFVGSFYDGVFRGKFTTSQGKEYPFIVSASF